MHVKIPYLNVAGTVIFSESDEGQRNLHNPKIQQRNRYSQNQIQCEKNKSMCCKWIHEKQDYHSDFTFMGII